MNRCWVVGGCRWCREVVGREVGWTCIYRARTKGRKAGSVGLWSWSWGPKRHRVEDELRLEDHEFGRGNDVYVVSGTAHRLRIVLGSQPGDAVRKQRAVMGHIEFIGASLCLDPRVGEHTRCHSQC
jgi:hypothetical protein